jgi:hypothetical protein
MIVNKSLFLVLLADSQVIHEDISHENNVLLCLLLQTSYEIQITGVTPFADTKEYVDQVEASTGSDGSKTTFSLKATVVKDVPEDAIVSSLTTVL